MSSSFHHFLKRLQWIDTSQLSFEMSRQELVDRLEDHLDPYRPQSLFEAFSSSPNDYVGEVRGNKIIMRRKRKIFDWSMGSVLVEGVIEERGRSVRIQSTIQFPSWIPAMVLSFFVLIYGTFFILALTGVFSEEVPMMWLFIVLHFLVLFTVFYLIFRMAIRSGKKHFERDMARYLEVSK